LSNKTCWHKKKNEFQHLKIIIHQFFELKLELQKIKEMQN